MLSSAGVRGATPEDEETVIKQANEYTAKLMKFLGKIHVSEQKQHLQQNQNELK